jgi:hypothetical protein
MLLNIQQHMVCVTYLQPMASCKAHYNFTHVQQLFATIDLTRNMDVNQNGTYPEQLQLNYPWLNEKFKHLRRQI